METYLGQQFDPKNYTDTRRAAQAIANSLRTDVGLEKNSLFHTFRIFLLPAPKNRCGHELRCEVVRPE